ncbi:transforming growth factor-beta receptor-associated protein 1 homolog [Amborella trichopoda]|uniref:CNH domain-containing protein n=1 Tax=Amborella trichopoda TaxID=13333 RepID=U5D3M7_AMBTC|nr:transforming growth factor-beta receptor-associated protein 1 homolog [Amborella trichopoda]ERN20206.1 hypothetical protein AMTR_s00066p00129430 [Amborella trichopoda]|eukprot:XP_020531930.1 transforming growth factor-beta receptor-associated protein 1 homolog [Amborella trichopoda]
MANIELKDRTVLEVVAEFDPFATSGFRPLTPRLIRSLSVAVKNSSETLVYVGTIDGKVILLSFNSSSKTTSFVKSVNVSSSSIVSIHILAGIGRIVGLTDNYVFSFDSYLTEPMRRIGFLKGASVLAMRYRSPNPENSKESKDLRGPSVNGTRVRFLEPISSQFAAVVGKKLILFEIRLSGRSDRNIDFSGKIYEFGSFYASILKDFQCADGISTMAWIDDSVIVGTNGGYTLISSITGRDTLIFSLPESSGHPYLKPFPMHRELLLLVDNVGVIVDGHGNPIGGSLIFRSNPESIGRTKTHVVAASNGRLDVYHRKTGSRVQSIVLASHGSGGPLVMANDESGSGELLMVSMASKICFLSQASAEEQIKDLLRKKFFKEAISLIEELECEGDMTKEICSFVHAQVGFLLLFDLHFEEAVNHFLQSDTMQPSEIFPFIMRDPNRWSLLVPRNRYWGLHPPPIPLEDVVDNGLMAIQREIFLRKAGVDTGADDGVLLSPPSRAELLESAIQNIVRYLEVSRNKDLDSSVKEGVDTLLMYLYRALNLHVEMEKLASSQNNCVVEELETLLEDSGHLRTLAYLYASKGMCSKALDIWRILARNYSAGLLKDPPAGLDVQYSFMKSLSGQWAAATEASHLLEESSDQKLVLQHLEWIADVDQELAVRVLTSKKRIDQLSPDEVLASIDPKKVEVHQRYLQWLIEDQGSDESYFHTMYALSLTKAVIETFQMESSHQNLEPCSGERITLSDGESSSHFSISIREKLQLFLQSSDLYDAEAVLDLIEGSKLWLEKAILYRKLGQEFLVLQILALKLEDSEAAERYCEEIGRNDAYMQLLDMYLDPQNGKEPMYNAAVRLLHNHGESLDPLQVLETLSPDMPLQLASETIQRMLRARVHHHHQGQIVHKLSRAINLDSKLARYEERSRHVQIHDESVCDSCHVRLGTKLFAIYPNDSVVCYKCFRRSGEHICPVTGRDFKREVIFKPGWLVKKP